MKCMVLCAGPMLAADRQRGSARTVFLVLVACAALFVWVTGRALPEIAAAHFGASGAANGYLPRTAYVWFMLGFVVGLPLLLVLVPSASLKNARAVIRLPNRDYWLAPQRQEATLDYLRQHMARFGSMLVLFLCYIHWLVVRANLASPPALPATWVIGGIAVFVLGALLWSWALLRRFGKVPGGS